MANIVTLAQVKNHLGYPSPSAPNADDVSLQMFIDAADEVIRYECDDILPKVFSESYDGGDYEIYLRHIPVLSVENIEEGWGWINWELDYVQVNSPPPYSMFAYSIDSADQGVITRRSAGNVQIPFRSGTSNISVQYTAGEAKTPANVTLAELELVSHWWQNSQLRAQALAGTNISFDGVSGANYTRDTETGVQNINIGVPMRILELLNAHRRRPIIS